MSLSQEAGWSLETCLVFAGSLLSLFSFSGCIGVATQGLLLAKQALCYLSHSISSFFS
jgi:hypothetical protein